MAQLGLFRHNSRDEEDSAAEYARHAERLGIASASTISSASSSAIEAKFITPQDPVLKTVDGGRLPAVPVDEAIRLNFLRDRAQGRDPKSRPSVPSRLRQAKDGSVHGINHCTSQPSGEPGVPLSKSLSLSKTNPLFPPLPIWGLPTPLRKLYSLIFRFSSAILSLCFLAVIILGALFTSLPGVLYNLWMRMTFRDPHKVRPFYEEEQKRSRTRRKLEQQWQKRTQDVDEKSVPSMHSDYDMHDHDDYRPIEGGPDPVICDAPYYARRVGLNMEEFSVQTEDGFILSLWHVYDPKEYTPVCSQHRRSKSPHVFRDDLLSEARKNSASANQYNDGARRYPILMMHGLLQSAGAYCCTDDDSLAFYLAKSGYDVWLGNNRCGFEPKHTQLNYGDPRMWAWNIRQMGVLDLPAFISRVLEETGFEKLALVAHSQGTTQTLVALAKEQRPDIGEKISVFCALAPAAYAGTLIKKMYFKFMQAITPAMFRSCLVFIHLFLL